MVDRAILDANGLRVSRAGVDVKTASPGDLTFSSDYAQAGLYAQYTATGNGTVNFGKNFSSVPLTFTHIRWQPTSGGVRRGSVIGPGVYCFYAANGAPEVVTMVRIYSDRIEHFRQGSASVVFNFSVFDFNL